MRCQHSLRRYSFLILVPVLLGSISGCQTMNAELTSMFGDEPAIAAAPPPPADAPKFYVEFRDDGKKPVLVAIPLTDVVYIQQALEQTNAFKRYRRSKIELYRQLPQGGGHKLPIEFNRAERKVPSGSDYALHPNDRLVVTEDPSNMIDDMMNSLSGN
jgi:hypothetical protein